MKARHVAGLGLALLTWQCMASSAPALDRYTVDSDGHPMAVWSKAPPAPVGTLLLLHGRTWSALPDFDLQVPGEDLSLMDGLVTAGYAVYAVDLRGYGSTPRDDTGWLSPGRAADDVINVLEWLNAETSTETRPILFGWSLGSMVAQLAVQRRPDLVSSVVLFGYPFSPGTTVPEVADPEQPARTPNTRAAAASDFIVEGAISRAAREAYVAAALAADPVRVDWNRRHEWTELSPARVTVPTLVLHGEFDPLAPTEAQAALFMQLGTSDKEWVVVPGGDHAAFLESPRPYFLAALVGFLSRPR